MIRFKDVKLGQKVNIYISDFDDGISIRIMGEDAPLKTLIGTVIGINTYGHSIVGWKKDEARPAKLIGKVRFTLESKPQYIQNFEDFEYAFRYYDDECFHSLASDVLTPKPVKVLYKEISDWRAWRHQVAGECFCGIPRDRCDYHS